MPDNLSNLIRKLEETELISIEALHEPLINNFLSENENLLILNQFLLNPTQNNKALLDRAFQEFYIKAKIVNYLSKTIYWKSVEYDKKMRHAASMSIPLLDEVKEDKPGYQFQSSDNVEKQVIESDNLPLAEKIENPLLRKAFEKLTDRQKEVLQHVYGYGQNMNETAMKMKVSQQAVSKIHKSAITFLQKQCKEGLK